MLSKSVTIDQLLIVFAVDAELDKKLAQYNVVKTGVGKVNAAYELMCGLAKFRAEHHCNPSLVLNVGSAGSTFFSKGTVVNCTQFIQRDMSAAALGFELYETPFDKTPAILKNGLRIEGQLEGVCGTGDSFVTQDEKSSWNVIDMEAYAIAKICYKENIPFGCLKYITDGADDDAAKDWGGAVDDSATALMKVLQSIYV